MYSIDLRLFDVVFMIDGLGDVDGDDDIGFEVGEDEDDVVKSDDEDEDDVIKNDGEDEDVVKYAGGEDEDKYDDDVSSLNIVSRDAI